MDSRKADLLREAPTLRPSISLDDDSEDGSDAKAFDLLAAVWGSAFEDDPR